MNQKIQLTRYVRVLSNVAVLTAAAAIAVTQAQAAGITFWGTNDLNAFKWVENGASSTGTQTNLTAPTSPGWTDAFGIAIDSAATPNVFVSDAGGNRVLEFNSSTSALIGTFATPPGNSGFNISPQEIALDASGNLYTVSFGGQVEQYLNPTGANTLLQTLPGARGILVNGTTTYVDVEGPYGSFSLDSFTTGTTGTVTTNTYTGICGTNVCGQVRGMAISGTTLYLADSTWLGTGQIDEINLTTFAETNVSFTGLDDPNSLSISGGNLYAANYGNDTVTDYALTGGAPLNTFTITGGNPQGIVFAGSEGTGSAEVGTPLFFTDVAPSPEPGTTSLLLLASAVLAAGAFWRRKVNATRPS